MLHLLFWLFAAGAATAVTLGWDTIRERLSRYKVTNSDIGVLIKESLASGNVRIVGQVFAPDGVTLRGEELIEADEATAFVREKFANANRVEISI
jgi:hypothetical protein